MKKFSLFFLVGLLLLTTAKAQERSVSGRVTSTEDGSPLPGVNVVVKGTANGTVTDTNGNYRLSVPSADASIVFSFIGLETKEIAVGDRSVIDVSLALDITQLSELVVTALGIEKSAKDVGYSVGKVKSDELTQARAINVGSALSGKVAGLQINTINNGVNPTTRIVLRGNRSLAGNNQALLVIDGVQVPIDAINFLNPNDIANVSVLKGANAAALYGSDASNGAIIITTKKGSKTTPEINYSNTTTWESINFMPKFQEEFGGGTEAFSRVFIPFENQSYGPRFDGQPVLMGRPLEDGSQEELPYAAVKDAKRKAFDIGLTSQNDLSFGTGDDKSSYFASLQRIDTKGIVPGDVSHRTTIRLNADRQFDRLRLSFNVSYSLKETERTTSLFYNNVLNTPANIPLTNYRDWRALKNADGTMNFANPNNYYNDYFDNPYAQKDQNRAYETTTYVIGKAEAGYKVTDWLDLTYRVGVTNEYFDDQTWSEKFEYTAFAKASGKATAATNKLGSSNATTGYENRLNTDFIASFKKTFGDFSTGLILGNNIRETKIVSNSVGASAIVVPGVYNVGNRVGEPTASQSESLQRIVSFYGSLTVSYKEFLSLEVTGREDKTSLLSKANSSFFYPGASLSFVATDAIPALRDNSILNYAKFFVNASRTGNVNVDPYGIQTVFNTGAGFPYGSNAGFTLGNTYADPNLKPEFTNGFEVGGEFTFFNDQVGLDLAYYTTETTNQTVEVDIAQSTGFNRARINTGAVSNNIYEVALKTTPVSTTSGLKVEIGVNYTYIDNEVTELFGDSKALNLSNLYGLTTDASLGQVFAEIGQQYPTVKATSYKRDAQGRVIVDKNTGYPVANAELRTYGQANPKHTVGIPIKVSYKNFNLNLLGEYRGGNVVFHGLASTMWFTGVAEATAAYGRERFVFPNSSYEDENGNFVANTTILTKDGGLGAWDSNLRNFGENFVTSGAFWKLREANLAYNFPRSVLTNIKFIKAASIAFVGRNLLTLVPKENKYTDPEFALDSSNAVGLNNNSLTPPTRTYGFNIKLTF
jgi:TonB-linked SusC/RagA family outer membrane protein